MGAYAVKLRLDSHVSPSDEIVHKISKSCSFGTFAFTSNSKPFVLYELSDGKLKTVIDPDVIFIYGSSHVSIISTPEASSFPTFSKLRLKFTVSPN